MNTSAREILEKERSLVTWIHDRILVDEGFEMAPYEIASVLAMSRLEQKDRDATFIAKRLN